MRRGPRPAAYEVVTESHSLQPDTALKASPCGLALFFFLNRLSNEGAL